MTNILMIAGITSCSLMFALPANVTVSPAGLVNSDTAVFAQDTCKAGYEWNE